MTSRLSSLTVGAVLGALVAGPALAAGPAATGGQTQYTPPQAGQQAQAPTSQVSQAQQQLRQQGYDVGQVDGKLGPKTKQALREFQQDKGLSASGQLDQQTAQALSSAGNIQQGQMPGPRGGATTNPGATNPGGGMMNDQTAPSAR